ncbi:MAG: tRNA (guanine(26)-N(2))-dimethyltransferase [Candidatus Woesearchaeota archaeon]|jgi:tRNA (guanine26-N2/guanine27-N2)-dimethyltransferase
MEQIIKEGNSNIYGELKKVVSADMDVFYNPVMQVNRDFTLLILASIDNTNMKIADPLAGSGIRTLRILDELPEKITTNRKGEEQKISQIFVNDLKKNYEKYFKKNIDLNNLNETQKNKISIFNNDARTFLIKNRPFDYIDVDPFGTPNPFLDSALQAIRNRGILAITATDTSSLCGSYPSACKRKYYATPLRNEWMHEFGARILIMKTQLIGAQYDKALIPVFTYAKDHYMKIFFRCEQGKSKVDKILFEHKTINFKNKPYGPIWTGPLWDAQIVNNMMKISNQESNNTKIQLSKETKKILSTINEEKNVDVLFFHDVHKLSEQKKTGNIPKFEKIIDSLKTKGFCASRTHFSLTGIKTNATKEEFEKIFDELNEK